MKASELRIGNWVHIIDGFLNGNCKIDMGQFAQMHYNSITVSPIPLTEEWLIRFGANYNLGKYWISVRLAVELYDEETHLVYFVDKHSTCTDLYRKIKYVHQLQNIYFALTGEELEIK